MEEIAPDQLTGSGDGEDVDDRIVLFLVEFAVRVVCLEGRRGRIRPAGMPEPLLVGGYRVRSLRNSRVVSMYVSTSDSSMA